MAVTAKLLRSDLPKQDRRPITDAVRALYDGLGKADRKEEAGGRNGKAPRGSNSPSKKRTARWADFARTLRLSLDKSFRPHWHVIVGTSLAFACKKRDTTMGLWQVTDGQADGERVTVLIWKSPGFEAQIAPEPSEEASTTDGAGDGEADTAAPSVAEASLRIEDASEADEAANALKAAFAAPLPTDEQERAQAVREKLTKELGTIWHVFIGEDFVVEAAPERRNFVTAKVDGRQRLVCFQHEQQGGDPARIDWTAVTSALPWVAALVLAALFVVALSVCGADASEAALPGGKGHLAGFVRRRICGADWETRYGTYAMGTIGVCLLSKRIVKRLFAV